MPHRSFSLLRVRREGGWGGGRGLAALPSSPIETTMGSSSALRSIPPDSRSRRHRSTGHAWKTCPAAPRAWRQSAIMAGTARPGQTGPAAAWERHMTQQAAPPWAAGVRPWLAAAGAALIVAALAAEGLARRYVVAESAQFVVFAMAAPALIVLGAPCGCCACPAPLPAPHAPIRPAPIRPAGRRRWTGWPPRASGRARSCARAATCWRSSAPAWPGGCRRSWTRWPGTRCSSCRNWSRC